MCEGVETKKVPYYGKGPENGQQVQEVVVGGRGFSSGSQIQH